MLPWSKIRRHHTHGSDFQFTNADFPISQGFSIYRFNVQLIDEFDCGISIYQILFQFTAGADTVRFQFTAGAERFQFPACHGTVHVIRFNLPMTL